MSDKKPKVARGLNAHNNENYIDREYYKRALADFLRRMLARGVKL